MFKKDGTFKQAFAEARKYGRKEFTWKGKKYSSARKDGKKLPNSPLTKVKKKVKKIAKKVVDPYGVIPKGKKVYRKIKKKLGYKEGGFKEDFAAARKAGKKTFTWKGKSYNTRIKGKKGILGTYDEITADNEGYINLNKDYQERMGWLKKKKKGDTVYGKIRKTVKKGKQIYKKVKKKLGYRDGGFRDTFLEPGIEDID